MSRERRKALLQGRIVAYAGLDPPAWLLEARLADRASALGVDVDEYLRLACGDDAAAGRELEALSEMLRVGETRFFRHRAQVTALREHVLPERARAAQLAGRPLRLWSAGCATGEEAWTLAMLADEARGPQTRSGRRADDAAVPSFEVLGTDLSEDALRHARRGVYPAERVADVPPELRAAYFERDSSTATLSARLRDRVRFERHNLLQANYRQLGSFDIILCRNVLIYFDAEARSEVIERLGLTLLPGGYLFLGYSETLRDHPQLFEDQRHGDWVTYRRRDGSVSQRRPPPAPPEPAAPPPESEPLFIEPRARLILRGDYHDGDRLAAELRPVIARGVAVVDLDGADFLGDDAARVLLRALEAAPRLELCASRPSVRRWLERHGLRGASK